MKKKSNELYEKIPRDIFLSFLFPMRIKGITLHENGEDIIIRIANFKRTIPYLMLLEIIKWQRLS